MRQTVTWMGSSYGPLQHLLSLWRCSGLFKVIRETKGYWYNAKRKVRSLPCDWSGFKTRPHLFFSPILTSSWRAAQLLSIPHSNGTLDNVHRAMWVQWCMFYCLHCSTPSLQHSGRVLIDFQFGICFTSDKNLPISTSWSAAQNLRWCKHDPRDSPIRLS